MKKLWALAAGIILLVGGVLFLSDWRLLFMEAPRGFRANRFGSTIAMVTNSIATVDSVSLMTPAEKYKDHGNFIFSYRDLTAVRDGKKALLAWPAVGGINTTTQQRMYLSQSPGMATTTATGLQFDDGRFCSIFTRIAIFGQVNYARDILLSNFRAAITPDMKIVKDEIGTDESGTDGKDVLLVVEQGRLTITLEYWAAEKVFEERREDKLCILKKRLWPGRS